MYGSRAITPFVLISDDVINLILKLDIQTNILVYVTRCCTDLTSKVIKERTFGQSSTVLLRQNSLDPRMLCTAVSEASFLASAISTKVSRICSFNLPYNFFRLSH